MSNLWEQNGTIKESADETALVECDDCPCGCACPTVTDCGSLPATKTVTLTGPGSGDCPDLGTLVGGGEYTLNRTWDPVFGCEYYYRQTFGDPWWDLEISLRCVADECWRLRVVIGSTSSFWFQVGNAWLSCHWESDARASVGDYNGPPDGEYVLNSPTTMDGAYCGCTDLYAEVA